MFTVDHCRLLANGVAGELSSDCHDHQRNRTIEKQVCSVSQLPLFCISYIKFVLYRYWPDQNGTKEYGKITVKNLVESSTLHYTLREFLVSMEGTGVERKVFHYHFTVSTCIWVRFL